MVYVVQGEKNSRKIRFDLFQNGMAYEIDQTSSVLISYKKPDGHGGMYDVLDNGESAFEFAEDSTNSVIITLAEQVLTTVGHVPLLVSFMVGDEILSTFNIVLDVSENPGIDVAESVDYFSLLVAIEAAKQVAGDMFDPNNLATKEDLNLAVKDVEENIAEVAENSKTLYVEISEIDGKYTADKAITIIDAAYKSGRIIKALIEDDGEKISIPLIGFIEGDTALYAGYGAYSNYIVISQTDIAVSVNNEIISAVKSVNGILPDHDGNIEIDTSGSEQNIGHPLAGKRLSIIGDSISTFSGYIPDGYESWYPKNYLDTVEKTWWHQLIQNTGMVLCKNASWSGSTLCGDSTSTSGIVGCSDARVDAASDEHEPDIIIVFIGINDFAKSNGYSCGEYDGSSAVTANTTVTSITDAYGLLLSKLRMRYPNAFICGCRIMPEKYSGGSMNASFSSGFPNVNPDDSVSLPVLNKRIEDICKAFGCGVIPMDASGISFYNVADCTGDGLHPNEVQMSRMALVAEKWLALYAGSDNKKDQQTPTSISASYSGSSVPVGTALTDLSDIVVTAHYSDGTTEIVTDYALSGEIAEGENIIVVTYEGLTTTFIVTGVANDRTILYNWDFTKSLTDSVSGATATPVLASGKGSTAAALPIQDNTGVHFIGGGQALDFGSIFALNRTYEIDVAEMDYKGPSGKNVRFFTLWQGAGSSTVSGFLYRGGTGAWNVYSSPSWGTGYSLTSPNDISGKTVKLKIASNGACELFLDNVSYGFGGRSFTADWNVLELGSSAMDSGTDCGNIGANLYNCTITGFRIYEGVD